MTPFLRRIRHCVEAHPVLTLFFSCVLALPVSGVLAGLQASSWRTQHAAQAIAVMREELRARTQNMAEKVDFKFETMHSLAALLAGGSGLAGALLDPDKLPEVSLRLQSIASTLRLHRALLINGRGVCVASNEENAADNLIGIDLHDREYVARALLGEHLTQFVVGRVSSVPGFHFSSPVLLRGKIVGVLALKMDLRTLADQLSLPSGIIADSMGVVVLSADHKRLLMAMPEAPALALDEEQCRRRYKRDRLEPLSLRTVQVFGQEAFLIGDEDTPSLVHVARVPREHLTAYGFQSLGPLMQETDKLFIQRATWFFVAIYLACCLLLGSLVYGIRDRSQRRALRALNLELAEQAQRDPLTGCYNRRPFTEIIQRESLRSARTGQPFTLAFIDLDRFKTVNDTHGHPVGDAVLVQVTEIIRRELRQVDTLARLGGDEFALLLPGADAQTAADVLRRVVERFQNTPLDTAIGQLWQTLSIGAVSSTGELTPQQMTDAADKALYESKRRGRNQVVVHRPDED
jgi:diguanylate cyclase (GGDEF) domain